MSYDFWKTTEPVDRYDDGERHEYPSPERRREIIRAVHEFFAELRGERQPHLRVRRAAKREGMER